MNRPCARCGISITEGTRCIPCQGARRPCARCGIVTRRIDGHCGRCAQIETQARIARQPWRAQYNTPEYRRNKRLALKRANGHCEHCHQPATATNPLRCDHIRPLSEGGTNTLNNLRCLHETCHRRKTRADQARRNRTQTTGQ